jgi:hypothetical protein
MVGIVIYCAESENEAEIGQKNKRNIWILVNGGAMTLRHYTLLICSK